MRTPTWVLGYHGCDKSIGEAVLAGTQELNLSRNSYDWLGHGVYFWEYDANRAYAWAQNSPKIQNPFVVGAIIDLGNCLDLLESESIDLVQDAYKSFCKMLGKNAIKPKNEGGPDLLNRELDCHVINHLHALMEGMPVEEQFDSVRAAFWEGKRIYSTSGFKKKTHIQICVRSEAQIIGYFRVKSVLSEI